ncbi:DUF4190 domain-containing protein [Pseudonocardia alni]|uniref:DUF4190 domain-containing protein n=1 Tax=Pseudonocardia alni TaxID=33907 RepID=UPI001AD68782|nr:DUF4190 domain-containing protein [Pseudonocardia alni]MBO4236991.1 DUF4352 domain-containing protein [Pseudonocardia alni]
MTYPQSPYPPGPHQPGWPPPQPPRNGMGTAALVLGILGALFSLIPIVGVIAWPMVLIGLALGIAGVLRAQAGRADNKGVAIAGTVLSAFGLVFCLIYTVAFASAVSGSSTGTATASGGSASAGTVIEQADRTSAPAVSARPTSGAAGATLGTRDGLQVTASALRDRSGFGGPHKCTDVTYRNGSDGTENFNIWDWKLQDPNGAIRRISIIGDNDLSSGELAPGGTAQGQVCFDAKTDPAGDWTIIYEGGLFGGEELRWAG